MVMLGAECSTCCTTCSCPQNEKLPSVVTATFSGLTKSAAKVSDLLSLSFKSCFGTDAAGTVEATGGMPNEGGPITAISLTSGGSGYAVRGRTAPTALSITGSGSDATFTVTVAARSPDDCGRPLWKISSVKVTKGGTGYTDNEQMSVSLGQEEFESEPASISIRTKPSEPTLTATFATGVSGSGAELSVSTKIVSTGPDRWGADKVTVLQPGSGYYDGDTVWFDPQAGETTVTRGYGLVELKRIQPTVAVNYYGQGFGAILTPLLAQITDGQGRKAWECSNVTINAAGSGYVTGQFIYVYGDGLGQFADPPSIWSITAGAGGAIVSLTRVTAGRLFAYADEIEAVKIENAGSYYGASDVVETVTVSDGGKYYKEDSSLAPIVADVTVEVSQSQPSNGAGAKITANVNKAVGDSGFGTISSVTLEDGGDDYLKWSYNIFDCPVDRLNGKSFAVPRWTPETKLTGLVGLSFSSCFGGGATGSVTVEGGDPGDGFPITKVTLGSGGQGYAVRGRTQPTGLSVSPPPYENGVAAQCQITLSAQGLDNCNRPHWSISKIKVIDGGEGYQDAAPVTITLGQDEFQQTAASLTSKTAVYEPELSASPLYPETSGTGAQLTVATKKVSDRRWGADYVTVGSPGTGYSEGDVIRFDPINGGITDGITGTGVVEVVRVEPTVTVDYFGSGSGAQFSPTLTKTTASGRDVWTCTQLAITSPGTGYFTGQNVYVRDERPFSEPSVWEILAGEDGAVIGVSSVSPGLLWQDDDGIAAVSVTFPGFYYATDGALQEVTIGSGGSYYKESNSLPPIVSPVTVQVTQSQPSHGAGAVVTATVNSDTSSPTFGAINSLTLVSGGNGYLDWSFPPSCFYEACIPTGILRVEYRGTASPPTARLRPYTNWNYLESWMCDISFEASPEAAPFSCSGVNFTLTDVFGGTMTVQPGAAGDVLTCEKFYDADSIDITLSGEDAVRTYTGSALYPWTAPFGCSPDMGVAEKAIGSDFSGSFTLQHVAGGVPRGMPKIYEYELGQSACGFPQKITMSVSLSNMAIFLSGVLKYDTWNYDGKTPVTEFACQDDPGECSTGKRVFKFKHHCGISTGTGCACDPGSFGPMAPLGCVRSDDDNCATSLAYAGGYVCIRGDEGSTTLQGNPFIVVESVTPGV